MGLGLLLFLFEVADRLSWFQLVVPAKSRCSGRTFGQPSSLWPHPVRRQRREYLPNKQDLIHFTGPWKTAFLPGGLCRQLSQI